jgi:phosphatidylinositol-bisphosphatase
MFSALYFSVNGTVYARACYVLPITPSLRIDIKYPTLVLTDGTDSYNVRFDSVGILITFVRTIYAKITELIRNSDKINSKMIYSAFFNEQTSDAHVENLPVENTKDLFKTNFKLSNEQGNIDDPIAVSMLLQQEKVFRNFIEKDIHVCTWNIDQKNPPENLAPLLSDAASKKCEIFVFCFQEIDMSMDAIMHGDSPQKKKAWDDALTELLNKNENYTLVASNQLGTAYIAVFVLNEKNVSNVAMSTITLGSMGFFNKSAVAVRFNYIDTSLCFICSHLSHGRKNVERRNQEFWIIQNEMKFDVNGEELSVDDHDAIIWSGDFNYRLTIPDPESRAKFEETKFLLEHDQLNIAHNNNKVFVGYSEGNITFRPTYKFDKGTDILDTSSKQRGPAWCDRIFLRMPGSVPFIQLKKYDSVKGMLMSDHHPVIADFHAKMWENDSKKAAALFEEVKAKADKLKWRTSLSEDIVNFGVVKLGEQKAHAIALRNEGQVPVIFAVQSDVPWINIHPQRATVPPEKEIQIVVSVLIDQATQANNPVLTSEFVKQIKFAFPSGKAPNFLYISGRYDLTPVGMPYEYLIRLPAALSTLPPCLFIPRFEGDLDSAPIMSFPPLTSGSYELNAVMDQLRKTYKDPQFFFKQGESEEILNIIEALRCRKDLSTYDFTEYSLGGVFLAILECVPTPFISPEFLKNWNTKEGVDAMAFISTLPDPARSTVHLITAFLMEVMNKFKGELEIESLAKLFGGIMTKHDPSVADLSEKMYIALLK